MVNDSNWDSILLKYPWSVYDVDSFKCIESSLSINPYTHNSWDLVLDRVRTGPWKSGKSWNLKIWIPGQESPWIFVEVLESPGISTYRSIFLIISIQEFSHYTFSELWVYILRVKGSWIHWNGPWIWHWKVLESAGIWDVKMCMNPALIMWLFLSFSDKCVGLNKTYLI